ncbi:MAG: WbqC family protein [Thermodesulfobacteriota bacterium]
MIAAVHQPQYFPWLGYYDKMAKADVFCYLDNVQYKKNEWQNRNRIKSVGGWQWLTVPVTYRFPQRINQVKIDRKTPWGKKHIQALTTCYRRAPFFDEYMSLFEPILRSDPERLSELNIALAEALRRALGIETKTVIASELAPLREEPTDRLIDICRELGADTYLAGRGGANYMDLSRFNDSGIRVVFQAFDHPVYPQLYGDFVANLSAVDLLFNRGPDSLAVIRGEGE